MNMMTDTASNHIAMLGSRAKTAARALALANTKTKNAALMAAAKALRTHTDALIAANDKDVAGLAGKDVNDAFVDRLRLDASRIEGIAQAIEKIAELPDPVGRDLGTTRRPNGLTIKRIAVPIGVIGMIYESRPNVGADASALCLKSGNAVILRGGSESSNSTKVIVTCMTEGLRTAGLPEDAVQMVGTTDRSAVAELLRAADFVDLVIPRGGKGLVKLVRDSAAVPTLLHLDGNCHTYIHQSADLEKAVAIVKNAKLRRTGICGATESLVIDSAIVRDVLPLLVEALEGCEIRGDETATSIAPGIKTATDADWGTEYLDSIISVKTVSGLDAAITHVQTYSSAHTDAIIAEDMDAVRTFQMAIDSAIVMHNASTQFADGGEFGMGAEIGIATGKMHARGPVGLEQLTSYKYLVEGDGQTRP